MERVAIRTNETDDVFFDIDSRPFAQAAQGMTHVEVKSTGNPDNKPIAGKYPAWHSDTDMEGFLI